MNRTFETSDNTDQVSVETELKQTRLAATVRNRRSVRWILAAVGFVLLIAVLLWSLHEHSPAIPEVPVANMHPDVVELLYQQRTRLEQSPRSAQAWGIYGMGLLQHERPREALVCFDQASRLQPTNARWPFYAGTILEQTDHAKAHDRYAHAIKLDAGHLSSLLRDAFVLIQMNQNDEAERLLQQVIGSSPSTAEAYVQLLRIARRKGDRVAADKIIADANQADAVSSELLLEAARLMAADGDMTRARETRDRALNVPPARSFHADTWLEELHQFDATGSIASAAADQLRSSGRIPQAADSFLTLARRFPGRSRPAMNRATLLLEMGQTAEAITELEELVKRFPDDPLIGFNLAFAKSVNGQSDQAEVILQNVVRMKPDFGPALAALADLYEKSNRDEDAVMMYEAAIRATPEFPEIYLALARLLLKLNRSDESLAVLSQGAPLAQNSQVRSEEFSRLRKQAQTAVPEAN